MGERIPVPFKGDGGETGELTWGQQHIWGAMQALGRPMNLCAVRPLPEGATVAEFVDELRFYLNRFQAMRTRLRFEPDGRPVQVVDACGEAALDIVDAADGDDPAELAAALARRQEDEPFDYVREYPIRKTLIRHRGALTHLVSTLCHLATDLGGAMAMYRDYAGRDPHTGEAARPVRMQPLELAALQRTPAARRRSDAALAYWDSALRALPARRAGAPASADSHSQAARYCQVEVESPATYLAARLIADRVRVDVATVLLALYAVALARFTGCSPSVIQLLVSNRFRPGLAQIVSNISQTGLCIVDATGVDLDEAVTRTRRASVLAYKYAYFDLLEWKELVARIRYERGEELDLGCYYNDRSPLRKETGPVPTPDEVRAALPHRGPLCWTDLEYFNERLMLTINGRPGAVSLLVSADTHHVPRAEMAALATGIEAIAAAGTG